MNIPSYVWIHFIPALLSILFIVYLSFMVINCNDRNIRSSIVFQLMFCLLFIIIMHVRKWSFYDQSFVGIEIMFFSMLLIINSEIYRKIIDEPMSRIKEFFSIINKLDIPEDDTEEIKGNFLNEITIIVAMQKKHKIMTYIVEIFGALMFISSTIVLLTTVK